MGKNKCGPGVVANQTQVCPDPNAVGIQSIVQSDDKTKLYVTYTNNTTQTFTLPSGTPGPIGPTGATGASGTGTLWNDFTAAATTSLGTEETLNTQSLLANTLKNVGDSIRLRYAWTCTNPASTGTLQSLTLSVGGKNVNFGAFGITSFNPKTINKIFVEAYVSLVSNTVAEVDSTLTYLEAAGPCYMMIQQYQSTFQITALNFAANQPVIATGSNAATTTIVTYTQGRADLFLI